MQTVVQQTTVKHPMETVRTPAQQNAYDRWRAQEDKKAQRDAENMQLLEDSLQKRYSRLSGQEKKRAIKKARKKALKKKEPPLAKIIGGGLPSLGKRR